MTERTVPASRRFDRDLSGTAGRDADQPCHFDADNLLRQMAAALSTAFTSYRYDGSEFVSIATEHELVDGEFEPRDLVLLSAGTDALSADDAGEPAVSPPVGGSPAHNSERA